MKDSLTLDTKHKLKKNKTLRVVKSMKTKKTEKKYFPTTYLKGDLS